jgi:hypothetical protein
VQKFFRLKGGFITVTVERVNNAPRMIVRHHDVDGVVVHETPLLPR